MRVGLVCPYSLGVHGGVQNHVLALADDLVASQHHVRVLAPGDPDSAATGRLPAYVTLTGRAIALPYNGAVGHVSFGPLVAARVRRWLVEGRFDVLHIHEPVSPSVSVLAMWSARSPIVATFHASHERSRTVETSAATVLRTGLAKIGAHIAVSEEARMTMERYLPVTPVVIPNGVRTADFAAPDIVASDRASGSPLMVFVGRLDEPRKGLRVLLHALPTVVREHPSARLVLVGAGSKRKALREVDPRFTDHVEVLGPVDDRTKAQLMADADLLVAPNTHGESFGIVLIEAMAAGTAVVASDLPAFRRVLGGGTYGELFRPGRSDALARAVCDLLADPQRREDLAEKGREGAAAYDWSVVTPRIVGVYKSLLEESSTDMAG